MYNLCIILKIYDHADIIKDKNISAVFPELEKL